MCTSDFTVHVRSKERVRTYARARGDARVARSVTCVADIGNQPSPSSLNPQLYTRLFAGGSSLHAGLATLFALLNSQMRAAYTWVSGSPVHNSIPSRARRLGDLTVHDHTVTESVGCIRYRTVIDLEPG